MTGGDRGTSAGEGEALRSNGAERGGRVMGAVRGRRGKGDEGEPGADTTLFTKHTELTVRIQRGSVRSVDLQRRRHDGRGLLSDVMHFYHSCILVSPN